LVQKNLVEKDTATFAILYFFILYKKRALSLALVLYM